MSESSRQVWILVPARGGSRGIPRKNLRRLSDRPLILHVLTELSMFFEKDRIVVSSDDSEIIALSRSLAVIHHRSPENTADKSTLDDVAVEVAKWLIEQGAKPNNPLITVQPTSPFLKTETIVKSIELLDQGAKSVLSVIDDRRLRWTLDDYNKPKPLFSRRVNRQWLPVTLAETGGIIGSRIEDIIATQTRIVEPIALIQVDKQEGLDIDTYADWAVAEYYFRRKRIVIRADASPTLGMGHVYRAIALAHELSEHSIRLITRGDGEYKLGADFLIDHPYLVETIRAEEEFFDRLAELTPDIVVMDILDTDEVYVRQIRQYVKIIVSLEDLGTGAQAVDVVINDLYTDLYPQQNHWYGIEYAILNPQFETIKPKKDLSQSVENILIVFGGTDPQNLTVKALSALSTINYRGNVTLVLGPGYAHPTIDLSAFGLNGNVMQSVTNMAMVMREADMAITSAGRTVTELMTLGVPMLVMCQNNKELGHTHASSPFGVINLGLGKHVEISTLAQHISMLLSDFSLRRSMRKRALNATRERSNRRVAQQILQTALQKSQVISEEVD